MEASRSSNDKEFAARRRLLKAAAYSPPAILGAMIAVPGIVHASGDDKKDGGGGAVDCGGGSVVISAGGNACCPCVPSSPQYNPTTCAWERCKQGNCSACPSGPYTSSSQCQIVSHACSCHCKKSGLKDAKGNVKGNVYNCG